MTVKVPVPFFISDPAPVIAPDRVAAKPLVSIVPAPNRLTALVELKAASVCSAPPLNVSAPVPRRESPATATVPPLNRVPPEIGICSGER